jgi:spermidine synthase
LNPFPKFRILLFFLISGATGLIYEVVWTRLLTLVMGNTQYSVATVLTAFMGGLALGSFLGGRLIDRGINPLKAYAVLEALIGVYCLLIPHLIDAALPLFKSIYQLAGDNYTTASLYRFGVCAAVLLVPASLMGATLPVLSKFVSRDEAGIGRDVGTLYAVNTFGAVIGALGSAYLLMRLFGVNGTIRAAAALNLGIAAFIGLTMKPLWRAPAPAAPAVPPTVRWGLREGALLLCFGLSGVSALVYQVAWNRILSLVLGSSIYAFSLILTTFILGLALGTIVFARRVERLMNPLGTFGALQLGIGFSALAVLPWFGRIPFINRWVYDNIGAGFGLIQGTNFFIIFALLFLPTFFMGAQFPVVVHLVARDLSRLGRHVGNIYASNTVGTIAGSFLGGFVLIPWVGIQNTVLLAVFLNLGIGLALLWSDPKLKLGLKLYGLPLVLLAGLAFARFVDPWDKGVISSGSFMPYRIEDLDVAAQGKNRILFYQEGTHTTVTTELAVSGNIFLRVNGKTDASLALDMRTQLLSGYLPLLLSHEPRSALVIGQGSGITLGAVEQFPLERIDLVEISPAVIEGSRYFSPFNHNALDDPRVNLILADGRNHVALTDRTYDAIVSEPSNPWISGVGALFTRDFFALLKAKLNPGGVACIWVHTNMSPESFKSIIRSFRAEFPFVTMWESIVGDDYLLIGSEEAHRMPYEKLEALLSSPAAGADLGQIGIRNVRDLMSLMIMDTGNLDRFSAGAPIHTDDNSLLEFNAPKYIYKDERDTLVRQLTPLATIDPGLVSFKSADNETQARVRWEISQASRSESQIAEIKRQGTIERLLKEAEKAYNREEGARALELYSQVWEMDPRNVMNYLNLGNVFLSLNRRTNAEDAYKKALDIHPYYIYAEEALARYYLSVRDGASARRVMERLHGWYAGDPQTRTLMGRVYAALKMNGPAVEQFTLALKDDADHALAHYYLGFQYQGTSPGLARKHLARFLALARSQGLSPRRIERAETILKKL